MVGDSSNPITSNGVSPNRRTSLWLAAALGAAAAGLVAWVLHVTGGDDDASRGDSAAVPSDDTTSPRDALVTNADLERVAVGARETRVVPRFEQRLVGRVVDGVGRAAVGATLVLAPLDASAGARLLGECDATGAFDVVVALERVPAALALAEPWELEEPLLLDTTRWNAPRTLVATRRFAVAGTVFDDAGEAVLGARVTWRADEGAYGPRDEPREQRVDDDGRFVLKRVPARPGLLIEGFAAGFEPALASLETAPDEPPPGDVALRLRPRPEHLFGRVTDAAGEPLEARVALGGRQTRSDAATGAFALDLRGYPPLDDPFAVAARGFAPVVLPDVGAEYERRGRRHPPLAITLHPAGVVAGRVLAHDGTPAEGARVSVREVAPLFDEYAEQVASASGELTREVGADGAFTLDGLSRGAVTVVAGDPDTLAYAERDVVPGALGSPGIDGSPAEVVLRLPAPNADRRDVRGTVLRRDGTPAEGVTVHAFLAMPGQPRRDHRFARSATVGADGGFVLTDLPRQDLFAGLDDPLSPREVPLPADATRLDLVASELCPIRVEWASGTAAPDSGFALDARGAELDLLRQQWGTYIESPRLTFVRERASEEAGARWGGEGIDYASIWVPENAATLVLRRRGVEVARLPLAPDPARQQVVHP